MKPVELIREVKRRSAGSWATLLPQCGVTVPAKGHHGPCAICGGTDRFHFMDDHGGGEWHCRQCDAPNHGDALDLIARANGQTVTAAAQLVAEVLGIGDREPVIASQGKTSMAADHQQAQERDAQAGQGRREKAAKFSHGWRKDSERATERPSPYLTRKGFPDVVYPVLPDGKTLVALVDESGAIVAGQRIPEHGEKRLITGSAKKGAFCLVNAVELPEMVILVEGLATAHSVTQMRPDALTVYAVDAGNLLPVADVMRRKYPDAQLIIAADNDWHAPGELDEKGKLKTNTGRIAAEKAAIAVNGWIAVPPTDHKADWNDYHQQYGLESAAAAFKTSMYQSGVKAKKKKEPPRQFSGGLDELVTGEVLSPEEVTMLEGINQEFTHVTIGGKHKVVSLKPSQAGGVTHVFEDLSQFQHYFHHLPRVAKKLAGTAWQSWQGKNYKPGGVGFYPVSEKCPADVFNLFGGLALDPVDGDCTPYLEHLQQVICAGNEEAYRYLIQWMAHLIQKPDDKPAVAIVMKSVPGTGKGTTVKPLLQILGQYAAHINGAGHIAGRFNATLANKLLVFADEVTVRTQAEGERLKAIISEETFNLERKGIDAEAMPNFARLIFASNSTQVLQAGIRERRYLVLEPSPEKAQRREYFNALHGWLENGGPEKLLGYLQKVDISTFDPQRAPQTDALREEILHGLSGIELFLYGELIKVPPFNGEVRIFASEMIERFMAWSQERGENIKDPAARSQVGKALSHLGLQKNGRSDRGKGIFYDLPDTEALQQAFARLVGMGGYDVF